MMMMMITMFTLTSSLIADTNVVKRIEWTFGSDVTSAIDASKGTRRENVFRVNCTITTTTTITGLPVVFRNAPSSTWDASNWTLSGIRRKVDKDLRLPVKVQTLQKFHLGCCVTKSLRAKTFFRRLQKEDFAKRDRQIAYFAGPLQFLGPALQNDVNISMYDAREVSPDSAYCQFIADTQCLRTSSLFFFSHLPTYTHTQSNTETTVWIGSRHATTPCHHDELHNFFVQIQGSKRFTLFPPDAWDELELFPKYHQYHRNVHANIDSSPPPKPIHKTSRMDVLMSPGDVLYLPPLWFHQVQALSSNSISVNVWSASRWIRDVMKVWNQDVPLDFKTENVNDLVTKIASYVKNIATDVLSNDSTTFFETVWRKRYNTKSSREMNQESAEYIQHHEYIKRVETNSPSFFVQSGISDPESTLRDVCRSSSSTTRPQQKTYEEHASRVGAIFREATRQNEMRGRVGWIRGATEIYLAHYLEDLISQVVGFQNVNYFYRECLLAGGGSGEGINKLIGGGDDKTEL